MKFIRITLLTLTITFFASCASGYRTIEPSSMTYFATNVVDNLKFDY